MIRLATLALVALSVACAANPTEDRSMPVDSGYVPPQALPSPVTTPGTWRIEGRYVSADAAGPQLTWAGTKFTFRFQGSSVAITYKDNSQYDNSNAYFNYYDVYVNGSKQPKIGLPAQTGSRTLIITAPTSAVHEVTLVKRTEEVAGVTQILGFDKTLLALPADTRTRKIEFVGDSLTSGYKIEGAFSAFGTATTNADLSYAALVAARLRAEPHIIACAGRGLTQDATGGALGGNMVDRWQRIQDGGTHPYTDGAAPDHLTAAWDFSTWQAGVVVVNLGTNDLIAGGAGFASMGLRGYFLNFYQLIRTKYPNAWIVGLMPSQPQGAQRTYLRGEIQGAIADFADARSSFLEFPVPDYGTDGMAGDGHPTPLTHQKQASLLLAHLQSTVGWQ